MLKTVEGIYRAGRIELAETPDDVREARVLVTFVETERTPPVTQHRQLVFGKYAGDGVTNDEDFKLAEFHGDPDDGLDWP